MSTALNITDAKRLDHRIRLMVSSIGDSMNKLYELVERAKAGDIHTALGFPSWTAYVADACKIHVRLDREQRREMVGWLSDEGMSQRAIAETVGVSQMTVNGDLRAAVGEQNCSPEPAVNPLAEVVDAVVEKAHQQGDTSSANIATIVSDTFCRVRAGEPKVTGIDGKQYGKQQAPRQRPRRPITDEFRHEILKWHPRVDRIAKLGADDRIARNIDGLVGSRNDLIRFRATLDEVIRQLGGESR